MLSNTSYMSVALQPAMTPLLESPMQHPSFSSIKSITLSFLKNIFMTKIL